MQSLTTFYGSTFYPDTINFHDVILNVNKIDTVLCFCKKISLVCLKVCMYKITDKSDNFSLNYSNLFWSPLFSGHGVVFLLCHKVITKAIASEADANKHNINSSNELASDILLFDVCHLFPVHPSLFLAL